ncbi:MAG: hypothetical protein PWQ96_288 [Clostridia bacterium]|jgi:hypothetical protein|nr:hypothetical protein [Clostridia bacterium]
MGNLEGKLGRILEIGERYLLKIIVFGVLLLIVVQSLLNYDYITYGWNLTQQEDSGGNISDESIISNSEKDYVTLKLLTYSSLHKAKVLINGNVVTNFNNNSVSFEVNPGDEIVVDCSFYANPIKFTVHTSQEVLLPTSDKVVTCTSGTILLGKVSKRNN